MNSQTFYKAWKQIIAKCWSDPAFKKKLLEHPETVLKEHGINLHNTKVSVHEDKPGQIHLSIPMKPKNLSENNLQIQAGDDDDTCASAASGSGSGSGI